ncbi:MAG: hypothetical protein WCL26_06335 [Actinomycetes bacterium]
MSTKTSFKRIAAVAAVALTLGGFSAVSANAAINADSLSVASATATGTVGTKATAAFTTSFIGSATGENTAVTAVLLSSPVGSVALPTVETTTTFTADTETVSGAVATNTFNGTNGTATYVSGTFNVALTAAVAGTYVVKLVQTLSSGTSLVTTAPTITFTISAKPAISAAASTVYNNYAYNASMSILNSYAAHSATTDAYNIACYDAVALCAEIQVNQSNGSTTSPLTAADASAITVTVSGPATVAINGTSGGFVAGLSTGVVAVETTAQVATLGLTPYVDVWSNGTPGTATITISAGTTVLATKKVSFFHTAATITPTVASPVVAIGANAAAITAVVSDASGFPVPNVHVYAVSDTAAAVSNSYTDCGLSSLTGVVSCALTGVAAGTANITLTLNSSATGTSTVSSKSAVRVAGPVASVKWALDSATYIPGALVTATVTLLDAAGLPVAPGTYTVFTAAPTFSMAPATTSPLAASVVVAAGSTTGTTTYTFNAPLVAGNLDIKATTATLATAANSAVAVVLSAVIAGGAAVDAAQAAQDAANEATDAANAATDAANNAMDSADAATAAAQDAGDKADAALAAITDLATKVSDIATQVSALSALVSKIAAAVAKISAKVKA